MDKQTKSSKPKFKIIQGGNERKIRLIRALDKPDLRVMQGSRRKLELELLKLSSQNLGTQQENVCLA